MVLFTQDNQWSEAIKGLGSALGQALQTRGQQISKRNQTQSILNGSLGQTAQGNLHPGETPGQNIQNDGFEQKEWSQNQIQAMFEVDPQRANLMEKQNQTIAKQRQEIQKRNFETFDDAKTATMSAEDNLSRVKQLSNLSDKIGEKQGQSFFERFLRTYRFDPETGGFTKIGKATSTPEEERYVKLIADATKDIKNDYGARITNLDMEVFLRRFPDLMQTPQGRKEIFETMKDYYEAKYIYNNVLKQQLRASKGNIDPYILDERVEELAKPKLDAIRKRMEERGFTASENFEVAEERAIIPQGEAQEEVISAINPQTGQRIILKEGKWVPAQ